MKTIIKSILFVAFVAVTFSGCQQQAEDFDVTLKSSVTPVLISKWTSGDAAFECAQTTCDGPYSFKIDVWGDDGLNPSGEYETDEGNIFNIIAGNEECKIDDAGITKCEYKSFNWESENPVCAVIVKAGRKAYIYYYNGAYSDDNLWAPDAKGISHVTFCYSLDPIVFAFKGIMTNSWTCTSGGPANLHYIGWYNFVPEYEGYKIFWSDYTTEVGKVVISNLDLDEYLEVEIDNSSYPSLFFREGYLFVGRLKEYNDLHSQYGGLFWQHFNYQTGRVNPAKSIRFELTF